eukprot:8971106-Heterocapsa_arctica.AAC.1
MVLVKTGGRKDIPLTKDLFPPRYHTSYVATGSRRRPAGCRALWRPTRRKGRPCAEALRRAPDT